MAKQSEHRPNNKARYNRHTKSITCEIKKNQNQNDDDRKAANKKHQNQVTSLYKSCCCSGYMCRAIHSVSFIIARIYDLIIIIIYICNGEMNCASALLFCLCLSFVEFHSEWNHFYISWRDWVGKTLVAWDKNALNIWMKLFV